MTVEEFQGNVTPPKLGPSNNTTIRLMIDILPKQSTALRASITHFMGWCISKNISSNKKAMLEIGRLIQEIQRHDKYCVEHHPELGLLLQQ